MCAMASSSITPRPTSACSSDGGDPVTHDRDADLRVVGGISSTPESNATETPPLRRLAYVEVELGPCEHCHQDARVHATDGRCWPGRPRPRGRPNPRHFYRGRRMSAFVDLDSGEYLA